MNFLKGSAVVGQSGGPTAAINATLAGVIRGVLSSEKVNTLYGMKNGIEGFMNESIINLSDVFMDNGKIDEEKLTKLSHTPAAALGSCRKKLPKPDEDHSFYENLISLFKKYDIRFFFYIGGNDSMDTVAKMSEYLKNSDWEMYVMGVPKTIDNDLCSTDHTPGFGSAAKYIATTMQEIIRDCSVYTIPAVTIVEIMGRDAGWLTVSAGLPALINGYGPDYIYLPEKAFSIDNFISDVKTALTKHPNVVIAVSEGIRDADGHYIGEGTQSGVLDVFGHKYLSGTGKALEIIVKEKIGCKVRSIELNLPQRCAAHLQSKCDIDESIEVGCNAANYALNGYTGRMISIFRKKGPEYSVDYKPLEISGIANAVRCVPDNFINTEGNNVTNEALEYILPLIQGECDITYYKGLPEFIIL